MSLPNLFKNIFYSELSAQGQDKDNLDQIWSRFVDNRHCNYCNGFYAQCHQRPVCVACHEFVCNWHEYIMEKPDQATEYAEDTDSEDSGNEDPEPERSDDLAASSRAQSQQSLPGILGQDKLQAQIQALSVYSRANRVTLAENWLESNVPPEILARILSTAGDLSLWSGSHVCQRWRKVVYKCSTDVFWRRRVEKRWPVFDWKCAQPVCWFKTYNALVQAAPCFECLRFPEERKSPNLYSNQMRKRIEKELEVLAVDTPSGIQAQPIDEIKSKWVCSIQGPVGTPYEGGKFFLSVEIPPAYPMKAPLIRFLTRIFHPNVSHHGDIGIDTLRELWCPALVVSKLLLSIQSILGDPNPHVCMENDIGLLYNENRPAFESLARLYTWKYAMTEVFLQ